ncbi:proline iminopeptidase [Fusarium longipes]|uniref:Proline iminopeptidase n=1 Tax=Fusarium longipes TaxID=694270 RepID=A0A395SGV2_9HYPO|nr:proline iminopeptidase [Fusarium longipes]
MKRAITQSLFRIAKPTLNTFVPRYRPISTAVGKTIRLPDGRHLGYHEFGEPAGIPLIYIHGTPDSGLTLSGFEDRLAKRLGVRWIASDRPGIGLSTFYQHRKVLDYPADMKALIQHLDLEKYSIIGTSGGTGYTLACAQAFPRNELLGVGVCAGVGPWEAGQQGQSETIQKLMMIWKDQNQEFVKYLESIFLAAAQDPDPGKMKAVWSEQLKGFAPEDRKVLETPSAFQSAVKVFRQVYSQGGAGHGLEMKLNTEYWGFKVEDINYEGIRLWYGSADENTSPEMGRYMAERLPKAVYKELNKTEDKQDAVDTVQQPVPVQPIPAHPKQNNKRKSTVADPNPRVTKKPQKTSKAVTAVSKTKKNANKSSNAPQVDRLSNLPPEIFSMVMNKIDHDNAALNKLSRTCKKYHELVTPQLYKRIAVAAMFHAHIPKLIRTLEPHLSIQQRKQLKKEGTYRGQKELYPKNLGPKEKPPCADHVRQFVFGAVGAGKKHDYIAYRYAEETLKNITNVEVVEALCVNESIAESIASLEKLQALSLRIQYQDFQPLHKVKNLKHLALNSYSSTIIADSLLFNSRSTLRSVELQISHFSFLNHWPRQIEEAREDTAQKHYFTSLKSLNISNHDRFDHDTTQSLIKAVDFLSLRELLLSNVQSDRGFLFHQLAELFATASTTGSGVHLRSLTIGMSVPGYGVTESEKQEVTAAKCDFLSSFDTLKTLDLYDYGQYKLEITENPGLPDMVAQAILRHKELEKLSISYNGVTCGYQLPYLKPATIGTLIDNLPLLREIDIAPEEHDLDEVGNALSRGSNLESITFSCTSSWANGIRSDDPTKPLLFAVLKGFLSRQDPNNGGSTRWEDICKLKRITVNCQTYEVASKFGKGGKGISKPEKFTLPSDPKRFVLFRDITGLGPRWIHVGFDPTLSWVEKVSKDLD